MPAKKEIFSKYEFRLSPSKISKFFEYDCDRHFVLNNLHTVCDSSFNKNSSETIASGKKIGSDGFSAFVGNEWEKIIISKLKQNEIVSVFDCEENKASGLIDIITDYIGSSTKKPLYIYQTSFCVSEDPFLGFESDYINEYNNNIKNEFSLNWSQVRPDLLVMEKYENGDVYLRVCDVKYAKRAHLSHKFQVALYILLLIQYMNEQCNNTKSEWKEESNEQGVFISPSGRRVCIETRTGFVFTNQDEKNLSEAADVKFEKMSENELIEQMETFLISDISEFIEELFGKRICKIINAASRAACEYTGSCDSIDELKREISKKMTFCIGSNCDGCGAVGKKQNVGFCVELGEQVKSVQLYPNMSRKAQLFIMKLAEKYPGLNLMSYEGIKNLKYTDELHMACIRELKGSLSWSKYSNRLNKDNFYKLFIERARTGKEKSSGSCIQDALSENYDQYFKNAENSTVRNMKNISSEEAELEIINRVKELSMQIPVGQDIALFMDINTAIDEDGKTICYSYAIELGYNEKNKNPWIKESFSEKHVSNSKMSEKLDSEFDVGNDFIEEVYGIISDVSDYNLELARKEKYSKELSLQGYVFDKNEYDTIYDFLIRKYQETLELQDLNKKIQYILFWIQGDQIVTNLNNHPHNVLDIPVAVILDEFKKLYEIPAYVTTNLWNITNCVRGMEDYTRNLYEAKEKFGYILSDDINITKIYDNQGIRLKKDNDNGNAEEISDLPKYMLYRLSAQNRIINWIQTDRKQNKRLLCRLTPFERPEEFNVHPYVSKLLFETMNEFYLDYCQKKRTVMRNPASVIAAKQEMVVVMSDYKDDSETNKRRYTAIIDKDVYTNKMFEAYLIINELNRQILAKTMSFDSLMKESIKDNVYVISNIYFYEDVDGDGNRDRMSFECKSEKEDEKVRQIMERLVREKKECFILEKPTSYTTLMLRNGLISLSNKEDVMRLFDPVSMYSSSEELEISGIDWSKPLNRLMEDNEYTKIKGNDFVGTQGDTFNQLCRKNITLLQGPPGTGKTDFIGRSVAALVKSKLEENTADRTFRILVSGFTHAAINNALRKIYEMLRDAELIKDLSDEHGNTLKSVKMFKDKNGEDKKIQVDGIEEILNMPSTIEDWKAFLVDEKEGDDTVKSIVQIVGATCWACCKTNGKINDEGIDTDFDLIIIDEASQLTVAQALLVMAYGKTESTHYLIVGDNHQLPPIIRGDYSIGGDEKNIYGSIFDFYYDESRRMDAEESYLYSLSTEFRMNEALCDYSAKSIYNPQFIRDQKYTAFDFSGNSLSIKNQKLNFVKNWKELVTKKWAEDAIDNEYPLTVIYLSGADAIQVGEKEAEFVALLTEYFQEILVDKNGQKYFDVYDDELPEMPGKPGVGLPVSIARFWGSELQKEHLKYVKSNEINIPDTAAFGILAPTHNQIQNITSKVQNAYTANYPEECKTHYSRSAKFYDGVCTVSKGRLLIDTVNKLQGQEREAVIMSYGVYDVEKAIAIGEFYYSYQRLNVALTRGKKKTILILADTLANKPIELLNTNNDDLIKGLSFLCNLDEYMQDTDGGRFGCASSEYEIDGVTMKIYKKKWIKD